MSEVNATRILLNVEGLAASVARRAGPELGLAALAREHVSVGGLSG
jgi:hypothetical protein